MISSEDRKCVERLAVHQPLLLPACEEGILLEY